MAKLTVSPQAEADLIDIWLHIAEDQPLNADRFLARLEMQAKRLSEFPEMGVTREDLGQALKSFPVDRYVLFYRVTPKEVELVRLLHSSRDVTLVF